MSLEIDSPEAVEDNQRAVSPQSRSKKKKAPVEVFQIRTYKQQLPPPQTEGSGTESLSTRSSTSKQVTQRLFKTNSKEVIFYSDTMLVNSMEETCEAIDDTQRKLDEAKSILTTALEKNADIMSPGSLERRKSLSQVIVEANAQEEEERNSALSIHADNNEVLMGQERLIKSLELPSLYVRNLNKRICEALKRSLVYLVVYAFAIVDEKIMYCGVAPQTQENIFPVPYAYEMTKNDYLPQHITKDQLLDEMTHFQENYKLVLAICKFLETGAETQYHYIIYKRPIDYYGKEIADSKTSISARLFNMKKTGFYYAIRINFGLTEPADKFPT
jgi:hypothetical protein